jgi:probable addiction module antidote protein
MSKRKYAASVSHRDATIAELRADHEFAVEYLKAGLEELQDPRYHVVGLMVLKEIAEAYGGLASVAQTAGITREALYRALSPKGNPTLKTLLAVMQAVGMRLSAVPVEGFVVPVAVKPAATKSVATKPAPMKLTVKKPVAAKPVAVKPVADKSSAARPAAAKRTATKRTPAKPIAAKPTPRTRKTTVPVQATR